VFGDIAKHVGKHLLRSKVVSGEQVDVVATADWRTATRDVQRTVIVVNRARAARSAHVAHLPGKVSRAVQYHASNANGGVDRSTLSPRNPKGTNDVYLKLQPLSITVLTMSGDN
jgi:enterochelin esterase-like enzyme